MKERRAILWWLFGGVAVFLSAMLGFWLAQHIVHPEKVWLTPSAKPTRHAQVPEYVPPLGKTPPPPPSMERMKREGCIVDGLLSGYGDENASIALVQRLPCYSLHRALETWLEPPDLKKAETVMEKVDKPVAVWGMFLAEAIEVTDEYYYADEKRLFRFRDMCRPDTKNRWGEHTCVPFTKRKEYRRYVEYITRQAMDVGVQNFMFGQLWLQDDARDTRMPEIIEQMREDARERGMEIVIGAQTNDIDDSEYLKMFDYIEGGVGLRSDGSVEGGPCFSRWWKKEGDWCWALLWNDRFRTQAKNVWVHLDWSGRRGDDMSTFARMNVSRREETLQRLHQEMLSRDVGFLLPVMTALPTNNGGCYGELERFYSASNKFGCKDEEGVAKILKDAWKYE